MNWSKGNNESRGANFKRNSKNHTQVSDAKNRGGAISKQFVDPLNRRVVPRELLFADIEPEDNQCKLESQQVQMSWTDQHWVRENEYAQASTSYKQKQRSNIRKSKMEKNYNAAVSQPVDAGKAASMMQKMGWQGGALGRSGSGITEPIVPNIAYATKTRGFGVFSMNPKTPTIRPNMTRTNFAKKTQKKIQKEILITNSLKQILQFVRNPAEIQILFDPMLYKNERKLIHSLVNDVINNAMDDITQLNSHLQFDILEEIYERNHYILGTQSEGVHPNRALCIYKEAPSHVYLVTPYDLKPDSIDENDAKDCSELGENKVHDETNDEKSINTKSDEEICTKTMKDDTKITPDDNKMTQVDSKLNITEINENNDMSSDTVMNNTSSIENVIDSDKQCDKQLNDDIGIENHVMDSNHEPKLNIEKKNDITKETDIEIIKEQSIIIIDSDEEEFVNNGINKTNTEKIESNVSNVENHKDTFVQNVEKTEVTKNDKQNEQHFNAAKANETEISNTKVIEILDTHADLINQLMEYFMEFLQADIYSEFRFLGPFDDEEINIINEFVNSLYYSVNDDKADTRFKEITDCINNNRYYIDIQNDINYGIVLVYFDINNVPI